MNHRIIFGILVLQYFCITWATTCDIRGLEPKKCAEFSGSTVSCGAPSGKSVPISQVNDNYCDCPKSGMDEPGTSACNMGQFYCRNAGHTPSLIPSSRVNDGICDCCDGSDEWETNACADTCKLAREIAMKEYLEKLEALKAGLQVKAKLASDGTQMIRDKQAKLTTITSQLGAKRAELEEKRAKKDDLETKEREYREELRKAAEEEEKKNREEEIRKELEGETEKEKVDGEETLEVKEPQGEVEVTTDGGTTTTTSETSDDEAKVKVQVEGEKQGDGVDHEFPYPDEYRPPKEEKEKEEEKQQEAFPYPDEYRPPDEEEEKEKKEDEEDDVKYDFEKDDEPDDDDIYEDHNTAPSEQNFDDDPIMKEKTQAANEARNAFNDVDREVRDLENNERDLNTFLGLNLGKDNEYAALYDSCFSVDVQKYVYEFCPFKNAEQKDGGSSTSLGSFTTFEINDDKIEMKFENGQSCWNGPSRSLKVTFKCGGENKVTTVTEPSMCTYEMGFLTPLACQQKDLDELKDFIENGPKEEL